MIDDIMFVVSDYFTYLKRRITVLAMVGMACFTIPMPMCTRVAEQNSLLSFDDIEVGAPAIRSLRCFGSDKHGPLKSLTYMEGIEELREVVGVADLLFALPDHLIIQVYSKATYNWWKGKRYFSDPLGKASLFGFFVDFLKSLGSTALLIMKPATEDAINAAKNPVTPGSDDGVQVVVKDDYIEFKPPEKEDDKDADGEDNRGLVGVIILPGALVSPYAYAPTARELARLGYPCFILILPLGLAFYGWSTAGTIIMRTPTPDRPGTKKWVLMGHSLGTIGMERFINGRPDLVDGAVYTGSSANGIKPEIKLPVLTVRGDRDGMTIDKKIQPNADVCIIEGGNHRGFASYTYQLLDWEATISIDDQRKQTLDAVLKFIKEKVVPKSS